MKYLNTYKLFLEYKDYIQNKIDDILDKISKEGIDSLSPEERAFMDSHKEGEESSEEGYKKLTSLSEPILNTDEVKPGGLNATISDWIEYAKSSGIDDNIITFIRNNPNYLKEYSPRIWEVISKSIQHAKSEYGIESVISVLTNKQIAKEYMNMFHI